MLSLYQTGCYSRLPTVSKLHRNDIHTICLCRSLHIEPDAHHPCLLSTYYCSRLSSLWTLNTFDNIQVIRSKTYQFFILQRANFQCQNELNNVMVFNFPDAHHPCLLSTYSFHTLHIKFDVLYPCLP
jgi:hypothetical protein